MKTRYWGTARAYCLEAMAGSVQANAPPSGQAGRLGVRYRRAGCSRRERWRSRRQAPGYRQPGGQAVHDTSRDVGGDKDELATSGVTHLHSVTNSLLAGQLSQYGGKSRDGYVV
jgi:hypothetical protein